MKSEPFISVVIPVYNAEKYIAETLQSVAEQTYTNYEIIIVDNASTDSSLDIVDSFSDKFKFLRVIRRKENSGGPALPRNVGAKHARGSYVAFLDSDDVWRSDKLEKQIKFMLEHNYNFSSTAITRIDNLSQPYQKNINSLKRDSKVAKLASDKLEYTLFKNNFITLSSTLIKRELLEDFNENKSFVGVEDYQLWLRLINKDKCHYGMLPETLVEYRVLMGSISHSNRVKQGAKTLQVLSEFLVFNQRNYKYFAHFSIKSIKLLVKSLM